MTSTSVRAIVETPNFQSEGFLSRYILARVGTRDWVLPAPWVVEVLRVRRTQVLNLPFYNSLLFGVTPHVGKILPLILSHHLFKVDLPVQEILTVIHLEMKESQIPSVGLIVDRVVGSCTRQELPADLFSADLSTLDSTDHFVFFNSDFLQKDLWKPLYWTFNL